MAAEDSGSNQRGVAFYYAAGLLSGVAAQIIAMGAVVLTVGPGHGPDTVFRWLFPVAFFLEPESLLLGGLMFVYIQTQYVVYGLCIGAVAARRDHLAWAWIPFAAHGLAWLWLGT